MLVITIGIVFASFLPLSDCLIPRICSRNVTLSNSTCCPIYNDFVCGGPFRGSCEVSILFQNHTEHSDVITGKLENDDRLNWPSRFFKFLCSCKSNYDGIACDKCKSGWQGKNCEVVSPRKIRQNILNMRSYDVFIFLSVLNISKYQLADFLITNSSSNLHCDPVNEDNIQLVNASIYDTMVYLHFYASRSTMSKELMESCTDKDNKLDFAHKGPAFFTWHRHYLLMFEDLLRSIAVEQFGYFNFTLPYWDWTNQTTCNICTNDLLGDIPTEDQESNSTFFKWKPICPQKPNDFDCHICDPSQEEPFLWRKYSSTVDRLPNQNEIDELFSINQYDSEPFNSSTFSRKSFRNFAEGYYRVDQNSDDMKMKDIGKGLPHQNIMMHNMVHSFINGTWMDFTTSPNDPLFLLHHTFMDKIFEIWLLRNRRSTYPGKSSTPIGQHADDFIVPFLPLIRNRNLFTSANEFGYAYDNNIVGNKLFKNHQLDFEKSSSEIYYILTAVAFVVLVATIVGLYCFRPSQISHTAYEFIEEDQEQEEKTNYFNNNEKMPLLK